MDVNLICAAILVAALLPCLAVCALCDAAHGLAAIEVAGTLTVTVMMLLSAGFHRQPFVDLAIVLALVSLIGALTFARLMEQDL